MKKFTCFVMNMILAYIGYLINNNLKSWNYCFCAIWGALTLLAALLIMDKIKLEI
ncbi:TPA: hypothetical protein ACH354_002200 [Clostridium perfringens]